LLLEAQPALSLPTAPLDFFTTPGVQAYFINKNSVTLVQTSDVIQFYVTFDGLTPTSCAGGPCSISNQGPVTNPNGAHSPFGSQSYLAWCPDVHGEFAKNTQSTPYTPFSTYSPSLPPNAQSSNWPQVNWVFNNKSIAIALDSTQYTWIVQQTIWKLMSGSYELNPWAETQS